MSDRLLKAFGIVLLLWIVAIAAVCATGQATKAAPPETKRPIITVIHAGHLIAEPGKPMLAKQSIVIENGKIVAIKEGFVSGDVVIELANSWVMPGLTDMHTHVTGVLDLSQPIGPVFVQAYMGRPAEIVLSMLPRMKMLLMNGFTTVRNVGDPSSTTYDLRKAINAGFVPGPRLVACEPQFSVDGGDYDASKWGLRQQFEPYLKNRGNCSGVTECMKVVREEVNRGADVIKFRQAGLPFEDPKVAMVETDAEIKAIIDTAHQLDKKVAVHVNGSPVFLHKVIEAGADTIEHGLLDDAAIAMMKQRGTAYTPTMLAAKIYTEATMAAGDPRNLFKEAVASVAKAYQAGVTIIFGTDLGIIPPERGYEEFGLMHAAGMPKDQVLRAATINAAIELGRADTMGSIAPGKIADVIAVKADPLVDLSVMKSVSFVMKDGVVFKDER